MVCEVAVATPNQVIVLAGGCIKGSKADERMEALMDTPRTFEVTFDVQVQAFRGGRLEIAFSVKAGVSAMHF